MTLLFDAAERILDRYEEKCEAKDFEFTPPSGKEPLGKYAFPGDVFQTIFMGVLTGVLTKALIHMLTLPFTKPDEPEKKVEAADQQLNSLIEEVKKSSGVLDEAISKLHDQGVKTEEARAALDLLMEALQEEMQELVSRTLKAK